MVLVNGGYSHCTDLRNSCKFFFESDKQKLAGVISKIQVSDPGPSWPFVQIMWKRGEKM